MDEWAKLETLMAEAKAEHLKYITENPKLIAENKALKDERFKLSKQIAESEEKLEQIKAESDLIVKSANDRQKDTESNIAKLKANFELECDNERQNIQSKTAQLEARELSLSEREQSIVEQEKLNVAKYVELDELAKTLQSQADEVKAATKALDIRTSDIQHEEAVLAKRTDELDEQESKLLIKEQSLDNREKSVLDNELKATANLQESETRLSEAVDKESSLKRYELGLDEKAKDLEARELKLKQRTDSFMDSIRTGKMV